VEVDDPSRAAEVAAAIDAAFENSSHQTYTETDKAFMAEMMSMGATWPCSSTESASRRASRSSSSPPTP